MKIWTPWAHLEHEIADLRKRCAYMSARIDTTEEYIDRRPTRSDVQRIVEAEIEQRTGMDMYFIEPGYVKLATRNDYYQAMDVIRGLERELHMLKRRPWWKRLLGIKRLGGN